MGTSTREFIHILHRHSGEFEEFFGIFEPRDIAEFIIQTISRNQIERTYDGYYPGSKEYVYRIKTDYLHIIVDEDGYIITSYPSYHG